MWLELLYYKNIFYYRTSLLQNFFNTDCGFETCFGWDPRHQMCWDPIAKYISNQEAAPSYL